MRPCSFGVITVQQQLRSFGNEREKRAREKICMQKEEERAVPAEWRSMTDREGLAIGRVRKLNR